MTCVAAPISWSETCGIMNDLSALYGQSPGAEVEEIEVR